MSPTARRTAIALLATALGVLPLKSLFSNWTWLIDVWLTMLIVIGPAILIRRTRAATALDIWPGIILLVPWLTLRFVPDHALAGLIPTAGTWSDVSGLLHDLHETSANEVAPIHTTVAVDLVVCALLGLLAALVDLIAVAGHRGALAGVPLLVVYTVSGAVPRHPVSWVWFVFAALAFLLLLGLDTDDRLDRWGRRFRSTRGARAPARWSAATLRIVGVAVVLALVAPLLVPGQSRNLLADAFHGGGSGGFGGGGSGGGISPFVGLKGQLDQPTPYPIASVRVSGGGTTEPFYLKVNTLDEFTGKGWRTADRGTTEDLGRTDFGADPVQDTPPSVEMQARIAVSGMTGNPGIFSTPEGISGLDGDNEWSRKDQIVLGDVHKGQVYVENFRQPQPTKAQLQAATGRPGPEFADLLELPQDYPSYASSLADRLTRADRTPYDKARAINDYFTDPANNFTYTLQTKPGDSGSVLVDFLKNKQGYCQQYAAAEAAMLRDLGIPSRIALGYMHGASDSSGAFSVTSADAHAWVEAYFPGLGWIPFDPTPSSGLAGGPQTDLAYAPHSYANNEGNDVPNKRSLTGSAVSSSAAGVSTAPTSSAAAPRASTDSGHGLSVVAIGWVLAGLLVLGLALTPAGTRAWRRRSRIRQAHQLGDADAVWAELSDTAVDLGYVWSLARSPRQAAEWLQRDAPASSRELQDLAAAVERRRYAPDGAAHDGASGPDTWVRDLHAITRELRAGRSRSTRIRSVLWPASLTTTGWWRRNAGRHQGSAAVAHDEDGADLPG